jgi:Arc/MetJ family transcription regulator
MPIGVDHRRARRPRRPKRIPEEGRHGGTRRPWYVYNHQQGYTSVRTNIVIDDKLMRDTLRATGLKTKREAVEEGLRTLLRLRRQAGIRRLRGKLDWQGDLSAKRSDS